MVERQDAGSIFRTDAATQQEWNIAIIFIQNLPVKLLTTSAHRLTFGVEKEIVNSAYILLIFLNVPGIGNTNGFDYLHIPLCCTQLLTLFPTLASMHLHRIQRE